MTATPIVVAPGPNARHRARERACELGLECGPLVEFEVYQTSTPKPLELELDVCSKPRVAP